MAHQSGIGLSADLATAFASAVDASSNVRFFHVRIVNESLVLQGDPVLLSKGWRDDLDLIRPVLDPKLPSFIIFRGDKKVSGESWICFSYVPDQATVRDKMLYASTRITFVKSLGESHFYDNVYGSDPLEFTKQGYAKHEAHCASDSPLTDREEEMRRIKMMEVSTDGSQARKSHAHGVAMPLTRDAEMALQKLVRGELQVVSLSIKDETITVVEEGSDIIQVFSTANVQSLPTYNFFRHANVLAFCYACPSSAPVKSKMVHASVRASVLTLAADLGVTTEKKFELENISEMNSAFLAEQFGQSAKDEKVAFKKPTRPGGGAARLTKPSATS